MDVPLRTAEFYSGVGGTHFAMDASGVACEVVAAFDINTTATQVYRHNFPGVSLKQKNILGLTVSELERLNADLWTMSPPCQPFTRQGKQQDVSDNRTSSFLRILDILKEIERPPRFFFLENVKGFETSEAHALFLSTLSGRGYSVKEFLVSPKQLGIPNSRLRYYALATLSNADSAAPASPTQEILEEFPSCSCDHPFPKVPDGAIINYLESQVELDEYLLPVDLLGKHGEVLDIVTPDSEGSCCFTRGYGHFAQGTGSVLYCGDREELAATYLKARESPEERGRILSVLQLRYFTPQEVANLMGFPPSFKIPEALSNKQMYRVLGNSVSVFVVCRLLHHLLRHS